jgi:hypothetical protein
MRKYDFQYDDEIKEVNRYLFCCIANELAEANRLKRLEIFLDNRENMTNYIADGTMQKNDLEDKA